MTSKLIPFPGRDKGDKIPRVSTAEDNIDNAAETNDEYINQLQQLNLQLLRLSEIFTVPTKDILSDFTYIVIGNDIIDTVNGTDA